METNFKEYNTQASWSPQQYQLYEGRVVTPQSSRQQLPRPQYVGQPQHGAGQKPKAAVKMPKARTLALANTLKRWLAIASIVSFGTFGGLVALHQVGTTTQTSSSSSTNSTSSSSSQNGNNFLQQQGGNTGGTSSSSTNNSSTSSSSSSAISGTHTS
jgi:hypothetical protein